MILFNRDTKANDFTFTISSDLNYPSGTSVSIRDAVDHLDLGVYSSNSVTFSNVASHSVRVLVI